MTVRDKEQGVIEQCVITQPGEAYHADKIVIRIDAEGDLGSLLEQAAKDGNAATIRQSLNELTAYLERVEVVFE